MSDNLVGEACNKTILKSLKEYYKKQQHKNIVLIFKLHQYDVTKLEDLSRNSYANETASQETYNKEEANAHHLGSALHAVIGQSTALNQLLGEDITHTHQRAWKRGNKNEGRETGCQSGICLPPLPSVKTHTQVTTPGANDRKHSFRFLPPHSLPTDWEMRCAIWGLGLIYSVR